VIRDSFSENDISKLSDIAYKIYFYFNHALDPISGMLLIYISIERYISIKYNTKRKFIKFLFNTIY